MSDFSKQAFRAYKEKLVGLPSFCRLVMLEIFEDCDYQSGTISINSLDQLAKDNFQVDHLCGRQREVINGNTIRNAFRAIKKAKPGYFKFTTVNQRIVIDMPFLRELHHSIYGEIKKVAAVLAVQVDVATTLVQSSRSADFEPISTGDVAGELAAASLHEAYNVRTYACAKIKTNFKTNKQTNKQTNARCEPFAELKKPIPRDFYPNQQTIELALSQGFLKATSDLEIKRFIMYNQASATLWADYNPVFLHWLERDHARNAEQKAVNPILRKKNHERSINKISSINSAVAEAIKRNQQIIDDHQQQAHDFIEGEYLEFVAISAGNV